MGLQAALATGNRALELFTVGIQVSSQNIANINTPGYIREELTVSSELTNITGQRVTGVRQQFDYFLEKQIHVANSQMGFSGARASMLRSLEGQLAELGKTDFSSNLNEFIGSLQNLANEPDSQSLKEIAIQEGGELAGSIQSLRTRVDSLRTEQSDHLSDLVKEANRLIDEIGELNPQIVKAELGGLLGSDAGALRSQRYEAISRLSEIIPIQANMNTDGSIAIWSDGNAVVIGDQKQHLETVNSIDHGVVVEHIQFSKTKASVSSETGELGGVVSARDELLGGFVDQLDELTRTLIQTFNTLHSSGEGTVGFQQATSSNAIQDSSQPLNQAGLPFTPTHGSFQLKITNTGTGLSSTSTINIDLDGIGTDTSLDDLRAALDGVDGISATITNTGKLQITAETGYEFRFGEDSSGVLNSLGLNTFFTGSDSNTIGINPALKTNPHLLATGKGGGDADNSVVKVLAEFQNQKISSLGGRNLDNYYETMIGNVAQTTANEVSRANGNENYLSSLQARREQTSGVSLDEETIRLLNYQRSFQAAARIVTTVNELMETLLSL